MVTKYLTHAIREIYNFSWGPGEILRVLRGSLWEKKMNKIVKHAPKVQIGGGETPAKIVKHVPKVQIGGGETPAKIVKHVPKVQIGGGETPVTTLKHFAR
jgi:hypothetical protein